MARTVLPVKVLTSVRSVATEKRAGETGLSDCTWTEIFKSLLYMTAQWTQPHFYNLSFFVLSLLRGCVTHSQRKAYKCGVGVPEVLGALHAVRRLVFWSFFSPGLGLTYSLYVKRTPYLCLLERTAFPTPTGGKRLWLCQAGDSPESWPIRGLKISDTQNSRNFSQPPSRSRKSVNVFPSLESPCHQDNVPQTFFI